LTQNNVLVSFLTRLSLLTIGIVFNAYAFTLSFIVFSFLSGLWRGGANDTTNHFTMISVLGGGIWKES
jgi:hypothetical protein